MQCMIEKFPSTLEHLQARAVNAKHLHARAVNAGYECKIAAFTLSMAARVGAPRVAASLGGKPLQRKPTDKLHFSTIPFSYLKLKNCAGLFHQKM